MPDGLIFPINAFAARFEAKIQRCLREVLVRGEEATRAQMIDVQPMRDWADEPLIREPVRVHRTHPIPHLGVTSRRMGAVPFPAAATCDLNAEQEPLKRCGVSHHLPHLPHQYWSLKTFCPAPGIAKRRASPAKSDAFTP